MRRLLAILGCLLSAPAVGDTLYKCEAPGQPPSYQSTPCSTGQRQARTWEAVPERAPSNAEHWRRYHERRRQAAGSAYLSKLAGTQRRGTGQGAAIRQQPRAPTACAAARAARDALVGRNNMGGDIDSRRAANDAVARHCQ